MSLRLSHGSLHKRGARDAEWKRGWKPDEREEAALLDVMVEEGATRQGIKSLYLEAGNAKEIDFYLELPEGM